MIDPPNITPGMAKIGLDPEGRLLSMVIVPGERTDPTAAVADADWAPLLRATGVDEKSVAPVSPEWAPPVFADRRAAWTASWPGKPGFALRIDAASAGGKPVALRVVLPWTQPNESPSTPSGFQSRAGQILGAVIVVLVVVTAGFVALRNVRRGRGDRRGALRFAMYLGAVRMLWFLGAHHVASPAETDAFMSHLAYAMWRFGTAYVFYLAIEPYARRLWPQVLVSWVRVLEGRFRDPLVGRDLMLGCGAGAIGALFECLRLWIPARIGGAVAIPQWAQWTFEPLRGAVPALVSILGVHTQELLSIVFPLTLLLIFRLLFRRTVPAMIAVSIIGIVLFFPDSGSPTAYLLNQVATLVVFGFVLFRSGILGFATAMNVTSLLTSLPLTPRPAGWYAGATVLSLAFIVAPAAYGFWISQSGRPLFRDDVLGPAARH
jgi:serine/threonine-protein kinase